MKHRGAAQYAIKFIAWRAFALVIGAGATLMSGCVSGASPAPQDYETPEARTRAEFEDAALAPLSDLNLRRTPIPERLAAIETPYGPVSLNCIDIASEVESLTMILGPDLDYQPPPDEAEDDDEDLSDMASDEATNYALDTVESTTTSFIPFRSVVRRATGATAHEKALRRAYEIGMQRRAYIKGVGRALSCVPPAAPTPPRERDHRIEYRGADPRD